MNFLRNYVKVALGQIILLVITQYTVAEMTGGGEKCTIECPRGEHNPGCSCRSNTYQCDDYNEQMGNCEQCKNPDLWKIKTDQVQGDYCVQKGVFIFIQIFIPLFVICMCCAVCLRKKFVSSKCCDDKQGVCYQVCYNSCLCVENVLKVCCCFTKDKGTPCYYYAYCFAPGAAFFPFIKKNIVTNHISNSTIVQNQLQQRQQMPNSNVSNRNGGVNINAPPNNCLIPAYVPPQQNNGDPISIGPTVGINNSNNNVVGQPILGNLVIDSTPTKNNSGLPIDTIQRLDSEPPKDNRVVPQLNNDQDLKYYNPPQTTKNENLDETIQPILQENNPNQILQDDENPISNPNQNNTVQNQILEPKKMLSTRNNRINPAPNVNQVNTEIKPRSNGNNIVLEDF